MSSLVSVERGVASGVVGSCRDTLVQRQLTLDVLGGKASCDYACGLKDGGNIETVCGELRNMFEYFRTIHTTKSHLLYFDYCGNVLETWGKTGGQQEDPLEMIVFCLSVHHLWDQTLNKHHQDVCAVAYADNGYIKAKLSIALEVLSDVKHVLKEDAGLDLNFDKTKILVKGISAADAHGNDLQDPATWMAPSLCQQMHEDLLQHYDCTDQSAAAQPTPAVWVQAAALLQMQSSGSHMCSLSYKILGSYSLPQ